MATRTLTDRAPAPPSAPPPAPPAGPPGGAGWLGRPAAFALTAAVLLAIFAWPFVTDPERVAPTKDPAFYTWRTEALRTEEPVRLLEIEGAEGMFAAGYRVTAPVLGALLRGIPAVGQLTVVTVLMVGLPVLISLLMAGFAYRHRGDPLVFHAVAFATGGLLLTPPFVGYLDNVLCLAWLSASLFFIEGTRDSWSARLAFGMFLLLAGLTHPTTLVIFCVVLGAMALGRAVYRRFDLRSTIRDDGPMLATGFAACVATVAVWMGGIWGKAVSLGEAALPPPYGSDFFIDRMMLWVDAMQPALNGPLFVIGAVGLLWAGRRAAEDELARVGLVWLAPLAGLFGFVGGLTYPYYRFFNTTMSWVLLVGMGAWMVARFVIATASRGGLARLALVGLVAVAAILASNFTKGLEVSGWSNPDNEWLSPQERRDLDALRAVLASQDPDRPVVFVIDDEPPAPFQIYGFSKLSGNTSRYGLPAGMIDQGYIYLGSVENFLAGRPTPSSGNETYDDLSPALLEDLRANAGDEEPIVVVASIFNPKGANAGIASGELPAPNDDVLVVHDGTVTQGGVSSAAVDEPGDPGVAHAAWVVAGLLLLLAPGAIAFRRVLPGAGIAEALGLVPALAAALLAVAGIAVVAVARAPFSNSIAWVTLAAACALGAVMGRLSPRS